VVMAAVCALANAEHPLVPTLRDNLQAIADAGAAKYVRTQSEQDIQCDDCDSAELHRALVLLCACSWHGLAFPS
jgi:hypothetical protein